MLQVQSVDLTNLHAGIRGFVRKTGLALPVVVKKETGELIKTLVKISPPHVPAKTRNNIQKTTISKFELAATGGNRSFEETSGRLSRTGLKWYSVNEKYLRGVAPQSDMRNASAQIVYKISQKLTKKGRLKLQFKRPRKRQQVLISSRILTSKPIVREVVSRIKKHVGRLKAGWLASVMHGAIQLSAGNHPPQWVTKHMNAGLRGDYQNGLNVPSAPSFTISNFAKGVRSKNALRLYQAAVNIRLKAMAKNASLYMQGKKNLADYART